MQYFDLVLNSSGCKKSVPKTRARTEEVLKSKNKKS